MVGSIFLSVNYLVPRREDDFGATAENGTTDKENSEKAVKRVKRGQIYFSYSIFDPGVVEGVEQSCG